MLWKAMKMMIDDDVYLGGVWPTLLSSIWRRMILTMVKRDPCRTGILPTGSLPYRHIVSEASMGNQHMFIGIEDDPYKNMLWLDGPYPTDVPLTQPGVVRGSCDASSGSPTDVESATPDPYVVFSNIRVGPIGFDRVVGGPTTTTTTPTHIPFSHSISKQMRRGAHTHKYTAQHIRPRLTHIHVPRTHHRKGCVTAVIPYTLTHPIHWKT